MRLRRRVERAGELGIMNERENSGEGEKNRRENEERKERRKKKEGGVR